MPTVMHRVARISRSLTAHQWVALLLARLAIGFFS
jgi:hypothetical protein